MTNTREWLIIFLGFVRSVKDWHISKVLITSILLMVIFYNTLYRLHIF